MEKIKWLVNCLMNPLVTGYGASFGTEYLFFPVVTLEESLLADSRIGKEKFRFMVEEEIETDSNDVWNQTRLKHVESITSAVDWYWS
jgi:hypothetical protein